MTTRYQKEHYGDVARILRYYRPTQRHSVFGKRSQGEFVAIAKDFAALFAADNPPVCRVAARHFAPCGDVCLSGGFNREQFLEACGLESEAAK